MTVTTEARVRYAETDGQRAAHHSVFLVWFELGRAAFLRECGVDYNALEDRGLFFVVVEARVRYLAPARYDDLVAIRTTLAAARSRALEFEYEVRRGETLLATGATRLSLVTAAGRAVALPGPVRRAVAGGDRPPPTRGDAIIRPMA